MNVFQAARFYEKHTELLQSAESHLIRADLGIAKLKIEEAAARRQAAVDRGERRRLRPAGCRGDASRYVTPAASPSAARNASCSAGVKVNTNEIA